MIEWKPPRLPSGAIILVALLIVALLDTQAISWILSRPASMISFVLGVGVALSLPLIAILAYRLYEIVSLRYLLGRDSLTILCGGRGYIVPLQEIRAIFKGPELAEEIAVSERRNGLGGWIGQGEMKDGGQLLFLATRPLEEQVLLKTPSRAYAVSPTNSSGFILALEARKNLGPVRQIEEASTAAAWLSWPIRQDRLALGLLASAVLASTLLYASVIWILPGLPLALPLHYNAWGIVDRIEPRGEILYLPSIGVFVLAFNSLLGIILHRREPLATYLLAAMALAVQLVLAIAVINIVS